MEHTMDFTNSDKYDYTMARPLTAVTDWERIIDSEGPYEEDGTMGPDDMFKLEHTGWTRRIEFKPK